MSGPDLFGRILDSLHACAFDDARWDAASGLVDAFCGTKGNHLVFGDGAASGDVDIFFARFCYRGERRADLEREYFGRWHGVDERLPRIRRLAAGRPASVRELLGEEAMRTSALYNELMARTDTRDSLNVRLDGPGGSRIVWAFADPADAEGWSDGQVERIGALLPHLRQFVRVRQALAGAQALGASMAALLDHVGTGVIQLDRRGRIGEVNDRARALLRAGAGLADRDGGLSAALPDEDAALQALLARALPSGNEPGAGGSMTVSGGESGSRLVLHVTPVSEGGAAPRAAEPGALVLVAAPAGRPGPDPERVGALLGLTPQESRLALALAEGRTVREVARAWGRSEHTLRWHRQHIYAKLGVHRQADLARAVMALAEVPGARRE